MTDVTSSTLNPDLIKTGHYNINGKNPISVTH